MRKAPQVFSKNKGTVRSLQRNTIERFLQAKLGDLRYFGLPSSALGDALDWAALFREFIAVERGEEGKEWDLQHELALQAFRTGLSGKIRLLRGDIDLIIKKGKDLFLNRLVFPFDVVSLDYSGGLFYRGKTGDLERLKTIEALLARQGEKRADFVLLVSCNLDQVDQREVRETIENIRTDLSRYGILADKVIDAYLAHTRDEARLKIYIPYSVNYLAAKYHYNCETEKVIFYEGNAKTPMMAFRFHLSFDLRTESLRFPRERLSQLLNAPLLEIVDGAPVGTSLGLPKLANPQRSERSNAEA